MVVHHLNYMLYCRFVAAINNHAWRTAKDCQLGIIPVALKFYIVLHQ